MYFESDASDHVQVSAASLEQLKKLKEKNLIFNSQSKKCYWGDHADNFSLKFTFRGEELYGLGKRTLRVHSRNFLVVNKDQVHNSWIASDIWVNSFSLYLNQTYLDRLLTSLLATEESLLDDPMLRREESFTFSQHLHAMSPEFQQVLLAFKQELEKGWLDPSATDEWLYTVLTRLITGYRQDLMKQVKSLPFVKYSTRTEIHKRVQIAKDWMDTCYMETVSIPHLAQISLMAENHLHRHFKSIYGTTPHQYLIQRRLESARELLQYSTLPVSEVVQRVGFENDSSFSRLFRKHFHCSPVQFRKLL